MITIRELLKHLEETLGDVRASGSAVELGALELRRVTTDQAAEVGCLSWISPRVASESPDRITAFRGSCLICPDSARVEPRDDVVHLLSPTPKLAIVAAIAYGFSDLTDSGLPKTGEPSVSPQARIGRGVSIGAGAVVGRGVVIGDNAIIGPNSVIAHCDIGAGSSVGASCTIGLPGFGYAKDDSGAWRRFPHVGRVVIEEDVHVGSNVCIDRGAIGDTRLCAGSRVDNLVHVAHNVTIGAGTLVIANSMLGGSAELGPDVWVAPSVSIMNQASIGAGATLGMGAVVLKSVEEGATVVGNPARKLQKR